VATFTLASDLKADALALAGEVTNGNSPYDGNVYEYLSSVQSAIIVGGHLGPNPRALPLIDWHWARARPRGAFALERPVNYDASNTLTVAQGATAATAGSSLGTANTYRYYRLVVPDEPQRPLVTAHTGTSVTLQLAWRGTALSASTDWMLYPESYALASDVVRVVGTLLIDVAPWEIPLIDLPAFEARFPRSAVQAGVPTHAAIVGDGRIAFSHYWLDGTDYGPTIEYDYIQRPTAFSTGSETPVVPYEHRRVLSFGAAWLMAALKQDGGRSELLWGMFQGAYEVMRREQTLREMGSSDFARIIARPNLGATRTLDTTDPYRS